MEYRKIIHIDMDAFYASVEQRDNPELKGKPIAVGLEEERGIVTTASYEARKFGVHSAIPSLRARKMCPQIIFVPPRMEVYKEVSMQVHEIFKRYTDVIEPISIDEAFLDVTQNKKQIPLAVNIAKEIKAAIWNELHLHASAGVSYNKFLAKIASDFRKPDGLCTIHPSQALDFISKLRIERFWGIGPKTAEKMHLMGIHIGKDLQKCSKSLLAVEFGKAGLTYYDFAHGIDDRQVETIHIRKSIGVERTLEKDITHTSAVIIELYHIVIELEERLKSHEFKGYTLTLKIKFHDFEQITRSITQQEELQTKAQILPLSKKLIKQVDYANHPIRLIGLTISNPKEEWDEEMPKKDLQLSFKFEDKEY
ncbi:MAG: DNA polymerase IV [Phocaeicola sp.]|uniref:DNA polymerase IV n=1 Tax=Phocaeicola TaxID=909656 RepID=UPI00234E89B1|nr:DNA polymerase IV [Phocaeicola oris]MCE2616835.1 DNA polymerase IV [Phocaeicola oris]